MTVDEPDKANVCPERNVPLADSGLKSTCSDYPAPRASRELGLLGRHREEALRWLQDTRDLGRYVDAAGRAVPDLRDGRRYNPRAIREMDTEPFGHARRRAC